MTRPREESPREESPAAQDPSGTGFPKQADRQSPRLMGRSRGFWRLTDAADYNRYGRDLLPAWAQVVLGMVGLALAGLFAWRATSPVPAGDFWRVLAYLLPVILIVIVLLVRAAGPDDDAE